MGVAVEAVITAPPLTPPPNGLLSAATVIEHTNEDSRWENGVTFAPESTDTGRVFDPCSVGTPTSTPNRPAKVIIAPFVVDVYDKCSTFGWEAAEYEARARRALAARESELVEFEFWTATKIAANRHLADPDTAKTQQLNSGTAVGIRTGLQLLVQAIADLKLGRGMIHATPGLVTAWSSMQLVRVDSSGNKIFTINGNPVVSGAGYPGTAPDGTAKSGTSEWAYVTDPVQVHRGEVQVYTPGTGGANVDRTNNAVISRAQRTYLISWNQIAVAGVNINKNQTS